MQKIKVTFFHNMTLKSSTPPILHFFPNHQVDPTLSQTNLNTHSKIPHFITLYTLSHSYFTPLSHPCFSTYFYLFPHTPTHPSPISHTLSLSLFRIFIQNNCIHPYLIYTPPSTHIALILLKYPHVIFPKSPLLYILFLHFYSKSYFSYIAASGFYIRKLIQELIRINKN